MASVHPFRRLRFGPPRRTPTQTFVRAQLQRHRLRRGGEWLRGYSGFVLLGVMLGLAAIALEPWRHDSAPAAGPTGVTARHAPHNDTVREYGLPNIRVIDGDTLHVRGERIRLFGFDAPELSQSCRNADGREWACGGEAKARLTALVSAGEFTCASRGRDRFGRTLAVCSAGQVDVGEALVREGLAVATDKYWRAEVAARFARRGLWQGEFERPGDWRQRDQLR